MAKRYSILSVCFLLVAIAAARPPIPGSTGARPGRSGNLGLAAGLPPLKPIDGAAQEELANYVVSLFAEFTPELSPSGARERWQIRGGTCQAASAAIDVSFVCNASFRASQGATVGAMLSYNAKASATLSDPLWWLTASFEPNSYDVYPTIAESEKLLARLPDLVAYRNGVAPSPGIQGIWQLAVPMPDGTYRATFNGYKGYETTDRHPLWSIERTIPRSATPRSE